MWTYRGEVGAGVTGIKPARCKGYNESGEGCMTSAALNLLGVN